MAELQQIKVDVSELQVGMVVSALDRPWSQTSFPLQGFRIHSSRELTALKTVCQYVYIDVQKSAFQSGAVKHKLIERSSSGKVRTSSKPLAIDHQRYEPKNQIPSSREFDQTSAKLKRTSNFVQSIYSDLRSGANIDEGALAEASSILTDAVVKMPAASFRFLSVL